MSKEQTPIFFDPSYTRGKVVKRLFILGSFFVLFLLVSVIISIIIKPHLPQVAFTKAHLIHYRQAKHNNKQTKIPTLSKEKTEYKTSEDPINMQAFSVERDDASFQSLKDHIAHIGTLYPERMTISSSGMQLINPEKTKRTLDFLKQYGQETKIFPTIQNFDSVTNTRKTNLLQQILPSTGQRLTLIQQVTDFLVKNNADGISIDFEELPDSLQGYFIQFLRELSTSCKNSGLQISVNLPFNNNSYDYQTIGTIVDNISIMAYDEHWASANPGPIAGYKRYTSGLQYLLTQVPKEKISIALGNYGYDRATGNNISSTKTFQEVITTMKESSGTITFDTGSLNPMTEYYDTANIYHQIRYLDAITFFNQVEIGQDLGINNFSLWRLGSEDPSLRDLLSTKSIEQNQSPTELASFDAGYSIDYEGNGELYKILSTPQKGSRSIQFDTGSNLIRDEQIDQFPVPYTIGRFGSFQTGKVVLSFDDGPDQKWTPQVLAILKQYNIPAVFFVIGEKAELYPNIIQQERDQGNVIGNHTFTHPNIALISTERMDGEINMTQRLLESTIGRSTVLFRPPYAEDIEPEIPDQALPLVKTTNLGYITVGMKIDPGDRRNPGTGKIIENTLSQLQDGKGNIVLLHDGGGDRSQTVAMLPTLIQTLRDNGYQFIGLPQYGNISRDTLMPIPSAKEKQLLIGDSIVYSLLRIISRIIYYVFIIGLIIGCSRSLLVGILAIYQKRKSKKQKNYDGYNPKVSVIVPAYNEGKVINKTIQSLFESTYTNFDIIVIDDGSKDNTYEVCWEKYNHHSHVKIFKKENGGKSKAINFGMQHSDAEIIIVLDADTVFAPNTIRDLTKHFLDPRIGAVAGNAKVGNRLNRLTKYQALEYITNQNLDRRAYEMMNAISIVPGAVGARKRDIIVQLGGFKSDTLAEDADLTIEVLKLGYKIIYEEHAIAYTEAPDTYRAFMKQRFRRSFGILQMTFKHADALIERKASPGLRFFVLPNLIIFQIIFPLIAPFIDILSLSAIIFSLINFGISQSTVPLFSFFHILFYYLIFTGIDLLAAMTGFWLEEKEDRRLLYLLPVQKLVYRFIMYYINLKAIRTAISGYRVGRGKLERKNTVTSR